MAGCFGGTASSRPDAPLSTVSPTSVAAVPATTIVRSAFEMGLDTPEAAAKNLWDAWRDDDRPRALAAAESVAVNTLFQDNWGPEVAEQGCVPVIADSVYRCAFVQGSAARLVEVRAVAGRYRAIRVERIGDLATSAGPLAANRPGPVGGPTTTLRPRPPVRARVTQPVRANGSADTTAGPSDGGPSLAATSRPTRPAKKRTPTTVQSEPIDTSPAPVPVQARAAESTVG